MKKFTGARRLYGVFYFKKKLEVEEFVKRADYYFCNPSIITPVRQVTIDLRVDDNVSAIVLTVEIAVDAVMDLEDEFTRVYETIFNQPPKRVYFTMPEEVKKMRLVKTYHLGQMRVSDFF